MKAREVGWSEEEDRGQGFVEGKNRRVRTKLQIGMFRSNVLSLYRIHRPVQVVCMLFFLPLDLRPALASPFADS